jgi:hypothetical protein
MPGRTGYVVAALLLVTGLAAAGTFLFLFLRLKDLGAYVSDQVSGLAVAVTDPDGRPVDVHAPGSTTSYEFGGREGHSIFAFEVDRPGTWGSPTASGAAWR